MVVAAMFLLENAVFSGQLCRDQLIDKWKPTYEAQSSGEG